MPSLEYAPSQRLGAAYTRTDALRSCVIAAPCALAGFTSAAWISVHAMFFSAALYLGHLPTTEIHPRAIPYTVLIPGAMQLPVAIVFSVLFGVLVLRHPLVRDRLSLQVLLPIALASVVLALHIADPLGARCWPIG
jgi:hypothetical protein